MGNPPPLRVDTPSLSWDPAVVSVPPVPAIPPGEDPMSAMISAVMPEIAAPLAAAVAATQAREEQFAANLASARNAYQSTDDAGEQEIRTVTDTELAPAGPAGVQSGQFVSTAMQTASQTPMQLAGMATTAIQGITQGAVQQIGQFGKAKATVDDGLPGESQRDDSDAVDEEAAAGDSSAEFAPSGQTLPPHSPVHHPLRS